MTENAILLHELEYLAFFVWPLALFADVLIAPQGFFARRSRILVYAALGPLGTADLVRRAIAARAQAAARGEAAPATLRRESVATLVGFLVLAGTGAALATQSRWPSWYFPLLHVHRGLGLAAAVGYVAYLALHLRRHASSAHAGAHLAFSAALVVVLLFVNIDAALPAAVLVAATATIFGTAMWLRRLDRRTEEGRSRGGLILNAYVLVVLASGLYLVPAVNVRIANNFGNYYYHLHGLVALFGLPVAAFLFLHHVRRTPRSIPAPLAVALVACGAALAAFTLRVADRKTHAADLESYRNQTLFAAPTVTGADVVAMGLDDVPLVTATSDRWRADMNEVERCAPCHDVLYAQWSGSGHALAGANTFYRAALAGLIERGQLAETAWCQACHQPALATHPDRAAATGAAALATDRGVTCKVCHLVHAVAPEPRNGALVFREEERPEEPAAAAAPDPGADLGPRDTGTQDATIQDARIQDATIQDARILDARIQDARIQDARIRDDLRLHLKAFSNSALFGSPELCASCHRIVIPGTGAVLPSPFDLASGAGRRADGDVASCKPCHMPEDARNAAGVHFPNHHMFGIQSAWTALLGDGTAEAIRHATEQGDHETTRWLEGRGSDDLGRYAVAADRPAFELAARHVDGADGADPHLAVELTSTRAGHPFPLGALDLVEAWLAVQVHDASGATLLASGRLDEAGRLPAEARRFGARLLTAAGEPIAHHDILAVAEVAEVRLLTPGRAHLETWPLPGTREARFPLTVRAELRYRRAGPAFTDHVFGAGVGRMPVVVLAFRSCAIERAGDACR